MTEVNIPLLRKAVEWAEAEAAKPPELCEWEQGWWILPARSNDPSLRHEIDPERVERDRSIGTKAESCGTCFCIAGYALHMQGKTVDYDGVGVSAAAEAAFGISPSAAARLFDSDNSIADVRRIAEEIAGERL